MAYVFDLLTKRFSAKHIIETASRLNHEIGDGWMCWSFSNHDVERVLTRWGLERHWENATPLLWALLLTLRGTACVYEGEELGLTDAAIPFDRIQDPCGKIGWPDSKGRDGCRTPMPWLADAPNAGFSLVEPWLPIPEMHKAKAVSLQDRDPASVLNRCRNITVWRRRHPVFRMGDMTFLPAPENVIALRRKFLGREILAAFNLGEKAETFAIEGKGWKALPGHGFHGIFTGDSVTIGGFDAFFAERLA